MGARVAIIGRDPDLRLAAARAFDGAPAGWTVRLFEQVPPEADAVVVCPDVDADGISFDPSHPERVLERVAETLRAPKAGYVILIAGVSGGVGTTSLSLHLCTSLARRGPTVYLELDENRGARHRLDHKAAKTWADIGNDEDTLLRAAIPVEGSFRVLLMPEDPAPESVPDVVNRCRALFRFVVIDAGAHPEPALEADASFLLLPPSVVGALRVQELLQREPAGQWALITNRLGPGSEMTRSMLERRCGRRIVMELPCAPGLRDGEDEGRLLGGPWSRWLRRVDRLAASFER